MSDVVQQPAPMSTARRTAGRPRMALPLLALVALLVVALTAIDAANPAPTLAAVNLVTRCEANVRTKPTTTSTRKATLPQGWKVVAVARVTGGSWKTVCNGRTTSGKTWYRISVINARSVKSRYGITYVYGAESLFKPVYTNTTLQTRCDGVSLRTSAGTSATRKTTLPDGVKVVSNGSVSGGSWSTSCAGSSSAGSTWYRITTVNGKSVSSLYGVSYLYGAKALFGAPDSTAAQPTPTPKPSPTPTPRPSPTPTPKPSATPAPSASATPTAAPSATPRPSPTPTPRPSPTPTPGSGYIEGIDVSHWQGVIDWPKVKAAGKRFAYIKASEHTSFVDDKWATNRAQAKANGILVGAYHFARPDTSTGDAVREADHFINIASPVKGELLPVLDLEVTGGLTDAQLSAWAKSFLDRVYARTGVKGAIYLSPSFWSNNAGNSQNLAVAGYKVLWVAHWTTGSSPAVPANNWGGNGWTFWQYTSSGSVNGISGRVDLNRYRFGSFTPVLIP